MIDWFKRNKEDLKERFLSYVIVDWFIKLFDKDN